MVRRTSGVAAAVLAAIVGCAPPAAESESADEASALQGGVADRGHPAVGMIWFEGGGHCTGTLVAPQVVLTAAHCIFYPIEGFYTGRGERTSQDDWTHLPANLTRHAVDSWVAHPSYVGSSRCPNPDTDLALVHLAEPIRGITPMRIAEGTPPVAGTTCEAVGYGAYWSGDRHFFGQKRKGTEIVRTITDSSVEVEFVTAIADSGDSGSPLICNGVIAGATSCHDDGDWPDHRLEYYARVDVAAVWLHAWAGLPH